MQVDGIVRKSEIGGFILVVFLSLHYGWRYQKVALAVLLLTDLNDK